MPERRRPAQTILAFDPGQHRIGVAVADRLVGTGRPLEVLKAHHGQPDWEGVRRLLEAWEPDALVVGVPRHADGSASASTEAAQRFARRLHGRFGMPVHEVDERLSSWEARQRTASPEAPVDDAAASVIAETWLREEAS